MGMAVSNDRLVRMANNIEIRQEENRMLLSGYFLKFDQQTLIGDEAYGFREVIAKGALDNTDMKKVPMKYNHDNSYLALASTRNGSLKLTVDDVGLYGEAELLPIQAHKDVYEMVRSGLLSKCSFAFSLDLENGSEWDWDAPIPVRTIKNIKRLHDVSVVDEPAYEDTEIYARSFDELEDHRKAVEAAKDEENRKMLGLQLELRLKLKK